MRYFLSITAIMFLILSFPAKAQYSGFYYKTKLTPLYAVYNSSLTDNVYTTLLNDAELLKSSYGYVNNGFNGSDIAMILPNGETSYPGIGLGGEARLVYRFYKGSPQTDHFYSIDQTEVDFVIDQGYSYENIAAGRFFEAQLLGSSPIYRLNKFNLVTSDLVHEYTVSSARRTELQTLGYSYDGVVGYGYPPAAATVSYPVLAKYITTLHVTPGQVWDYRGSIYTESNWLCLGHVDITVDGIFRGRFSDWLFGPLPWSSSQWGCYANTHISISGNHTVRAAYSGARGTMISSNGVGYLSPTILSPTVHTAQQVW